MKLVGDYSDPEYECQDCEQQFQLFFQISAECRKIKYCPFCGEDVDEVIDEMV